MKKIVRSILIIELEKLVVLSEEVKFLHDICDFHAQQTGSKEDENKKSVKRENKKSVKRDLEKNFLHLKDALSELRTEKIEVAYNNINELLLLKKNLDDRERAIYTNFYKKEIVDIIETLKLINSKTSQMFRDGYNQYIPKPTPGRMYSNINVASQVEKNMEDRLEHLLKEESGESSSSTMPLTRNKIKSCIFEKKESANIIYENMSNFPVQIIWDFVDSYEIKKADLDNKNLYFLRMSYWYFDLPFLLPALTHELAHIAIEQKDSSKNYKNNLHQTLRTKLGQELLVMTNGDIDRNLDLEKLSNEIVADILSFLYHGDSFLLTHIHTFFGYSLSETFYIKKSPENYEEYISINTWIFDYHRDSIFIRLSALMHVRSIFYEKNKELFFMDNELRDEIYELLDMVYPFEMKNKSIKTIEEYYNNWANFTAEYQEIKKIINSLLIAIKIYLEENSEFLSHKLDETKKEKTEDENNDSNIIPEHFNDLWKNRFKTKDLENNKVPHKFELRKKIHRDTLNKLIKEKLLSYDSIKPYTLIMYKYKLDNLSSEDKEILKKENISLGENQYTNNMILYTLGLYDKVKLRVESEKKYPTLVDDKKIHSKRYVIKTSLIKILNDIGGNISNANDDNTLNIFIQIEIDKNMNERDIYDNLYCAIKYIHDVLDDYTNDFSRVQVFKSLGPKDLLIFVEKIHIDKLYSLKEELANHFPRTFSTISFSDKQSSFKSDRCYRLFTELRLSEKAKDEQAKDEKANDEKVYNKLILNHNSKDIIEKIFSITGVMDYRIIWKKGTTLEDINKLYEFMIKNGYVSDMQTKIAHKKNTTVSVDFIVQ